VRLAFAFVLLLLATMNLFGCSGADPMQEALDTSVDAKSRPEAAAVATPASSGQPESTVGVASSDAVEDGAGGAG